MKAQLQSIESRLTLYVLIFSILLGVAFSAVQIGFDYVGDRQRFSLQTREMLARQEASAALALYNYDDNALHTILESLQMNPAVVAAEVVEFGSEYKVHSGLTIDQRNRPDSRPHMQTFRQDLMEPQNYSSGQKNLGVLTVWADTRLLHQGFEQRAALTLVLDVLRNIVLAFVLIMVFRSRLTGPIRRLTSKILQVDPQAPVKMPLAVEKQLKGSELDDLIHKMNALLTSMDGEMNQRYLAEKQVRFLNEKLEEKVRDRTRALHESNQQLQSSLDELRQTQDLLVKAQHMAALGQLAGGMAHEINNPIAVVNSNLTTLADYLTDLIELGEKSAEAEAIIADGRIVAELKQLREQIDFDFIRDDAPDLVAASRQSICRVQNIVEELQTFVGGEDQERQLAQLSDLFWRAVDDNKLNDDNNIHISHNFDLVVEPLLCNTRQVTMVLGKVLRNARDAMPEGGKIEAALLEEDDALVLAIKDEGVGMSEEELLYATNPFFTRKEVGQGMGMGLTVAYNVMANHKGSLEIDSSPGSGTCVTLTFPLHPEVDHQS